MNVDARTASIVRFSGWLVYAVLVAAAMGLHSTTAPGEFTTLLSDAFLYLSPAALTLFGAFALSTRTDLEERLLWRLIGIISAVVLGAETYFVWYVTFVSVRGPDMPAFYQLLQLIAVLLGVWVVATLTAFGAAPLRSVLRLCFDVFGGTIVLGAACYWYFVLPLFRTVPGVPWRAAAIAAVYPVVGLTIVGFMAAAAAGGRTYRWRSWERLIALAFLLYGAALITTPYTYIRVRSAAPPANQLWTTAALGIGYYVLFMAIVYRFTAADDDTGIEPWLFPKLGPRWLPTVYPILLAAALPVLGGSAYKIGPVPEGIPISLAAMLLAAVLVVRSWLGSSETVLHRELAMTDSVSGAFNYRYLRQRLVGDIAYAQGVGSRIAVITMQIEGLRTVVDVAGSAAQERALRTIADAVRGRAHRDATLCRSASDAFVLIARGRDAAEAVELAEEAMRAAAGSVERLGVHMGFSAGVAVFPDHGRDVDELIARSGSAQTVAASAGEGTAVVYDEQQATGAGVRARPVVARVQSRRATTRALAAAVDARDPATRRHSENVADLASALALVLNLSPERSQVLDLAAQMHDVGMIGVPDAVLGSSGELVGAEREQAEQHAILGERILASARLDEIAPAVRHHHERWDGTGYPDGLSGPGIPLEARILAVCDAYESMTAPHSYEEGRTVEEAVEEIRRCSGKQFDPDVAATFCRMILQIHSASPRDHAGRTGGQAGTNGRVTGSL